MAMNRKEMNREARRMIAKIAEERGLDKCELCGDTFGCAPAHKEKRIAYGTAAELADYNNWICLCQKCHTVLDDRSLTTKKELDAIFSSLRER